jgi:DNA-binding CsgD family transcriptional regulator
MTSDIVGREDELASVRSFIDRALSDLSAGFVLEGPPGIGKSILLSAAVGIARDRGMRVLSARPAEAERSLPYAGLEDLFDGVLDEVLPELPTPRRMALEIVILRHGELGDRADPRAVAAAVRSSLEIISSRGPVLIAVDDVQWLDAPTTAALAFAVRRSRERPVITVLAKRAGENTVPSDLETARELERLVLGPISVDATHALLRERLGRVFPRPTLMRIHEASGGNPLYAVEIGRALGPDVDPTQRLPMPETLEGLVGARLRDLPETTRDALALAAVLSGAGAAIFEAAGSAEDLDPALAANIIEVDGRLIRFTHPLFPSVLYQGLSAGARRRVHARATELVDDPIERAGHLARASAHPDATIANLVEDAATLSSQRGAAVTAAELGEHAIRLTPPEDIAEVVRRTILAASAHIAAGEGSRARTMALELIERAPRGLLRAEALLLLSEVEDLGRVLQVLEQALDEAHGHPALEVSIRAQLVARGRMLKGWVWAEEQARAAVASAERLGDDETLARALSALGVTLFNRGDPEALAFARRAFRHAVSVDDPITRRAASHALGQILTRTAQVEEARAFVESEIREWSERDELMTASMLWNLSFIEFFAGRWALADEHAARVLDLHQQYGVRLEPPTFFLAAFMAVHRGDVDRARALAARGNDVLRTSGAKLAGLVGVLGLIDFWTGDAAGAVERFAEADAVARAAGWREPMFFTWRTDEVEALLALGRIDEAVELLDEWVADAERLGRVWALAHAERCRGLLEAARGEIDAASRHLELAIARHETLGDPFGRGRALLGLGIVRRRARQKRGSREAIEEARAIFEELGAGLWSARADSELGRIGGRTRASELTEVERRVARLVAEGRTNREVAAALFLADRTVASHLTRIYAKLDVRSRTELAHRIRADDEN